MARITIINGPNLNLLGQRETNLYGNQTLDALNDELATVAHQLGHQLTTQQSNAEHELINWIQASQQTADCLIMNAAAYSHTSVAIRDALLAVDLPLFEVHISNIYAREDYRHHSLLADIAQGVIVGCGTYGYTLALHAANHYLAQTTG